MNQLINIKTIGTFICLLVTTEISFGQIQWSDWKQLTDDSKISYRIAFAKKDEINGLSGYYLEFKNDHSSRIWFNFSLSKSDASKETVSKISLKAGNSSLVGIHYTDISELKMLSIKVSDIKSDD